MHFRKMITLLFCLPLPALAQNCNYNINYSCWFNQSSNVNSLSWGPDGSKLAVQKPSSYDFCGNAGTNPVLDMSSGTVTRSTTLSKNYATASANLTYAPTGGIFVNNYYIKPSGTQVAATSGGENIDNSTASVNRDTVIYISTNGGSAFLNYADVSNPESPTFHKISTIYGISNNATGLPVGAEAIATAGNRIYIATNNADVPNDPVIIKCRDFSGNACPNWGDVTISNGKVFDMAIRPTDGLIFIRGNLKGFGSSGWQAAQPGLVIVDSTGNKAPGFNHTDLSLITAYPVYANGGGNYLIRFDNQGNIFANMPMLEGSTAHGIGIYKFDPKGNLDVGFMRNVTNSYILPGVTAIDYFDVNPVSGELAVVANDGVWMGQFHALKGGEHKQANNELWDTAFQSVYAGDGASTNGQRASSGYNIMHILYNNGKLKVQGESAATQNANCGVSTAVIVPQRDKATGSIQCNNLAFITAPVPGTPATLVVKIPVNVTTAGAFSPVSINGSGMSLQDPYTTFATSSTGQTDFYLTVKYDGSSLGNCTINAGGAGSCTQNLADQTNNKSSVIDIWTPANCTYKTLGPDLK